MIHADAAPARLDPAAGVVAAAFPGAGHVLRGERLRGLYIAVGVLGLWITGLLVGGIDAIDSREDRLWFFGQAFVGPLTFAVDTIHQSRFKAYDEGELLDPRPPVAGQPRRIPQPRSAYPGERRVEATIRGQTYWVWQDAPDASTEPPSRKSLAKVNELAALITTLAGMLNFLAILDALIPGRRQGKPAGGEDRP